MKKIVALIFTGLLTLPHFASANEACDDLWFVRNSIFDAKGYCFGSVLGKSVFNNSDCTTKSPNLSAKSIAKVAQVKAMEKQWECRVDSNRNTLDIHSFDLRRKLIEQPIHDFTESGCSNYLGKDVPLYAGPDTSSEIIGYIRTGSDFVNSHISFDETTNAKWFFVSGMSENDLTVPDIGWSNHENIFNECELAAG